MNIEIKILIYTKILSKFSNFMKQVRKKKKAPAPKGPILSLGRTNYILFGLAAVVIALGYVFLSIGPADSIQSLTIAPIILFIGYVVLVPLAIFWRDNKGSHAD